MNITSFHPRNKHQGQYDLDALKMSSPEFARYVVKNKYGNESIDFSDNKAVLALNRALLFHYYGLSFWEIPPQFLCPPIPGRADYIHHLADLLSSQNNKGEQVKILDIGVGANCIYPIIGHCEYGWSFRGVDINPKAINAAQMIIQQNAPILNHIELRLQKNHKNIFKDMIEPDDRFDAVICNPPFHSSLEEAQAGTRRKWKNLGKKNLKDSNFGGQESELWCEGGELFFIEQMISESQNFKHQCKWFTTLVSKEENLPQIDSFLKKAHVAKNLLIDMSQGQKKSRIKAWSF